MIPAVPATSYAWLQDLRVKKLFSKYYENSMISGEFCDKNLFCAPQSSSFMKSKLISMLRMPNLNIKIKRKRK